MGACQTTPTATKTPGPPTTLNSPTQKPTRSSSRPMMRRRSSASSSYVLARSFLTGCGRSNWTPPTRLRDRRRRGTTNNKDHRHPGDTNRAAGSGLYARLTSAPSWVPPSASSAGPDRATVLGLTHRGQRAAEPRRGGARGHRTTVISLDSALSLPLGVVQVDGRDEGKPGGLHDIRGRRPNRNPLARQLHLELDLSDRLAARAD